MFRAEKIAKTVGTLAAPGPKDGRYLSGVLVQKDFGHTIIAATELPTYTQLKINTIVQKQSIPCHLPLDVLRHALEQMYEGVESSVDKENKEVLRVYDALTISVHPNTHVVFEWTANPVNDMIADSALALVLQLESNPSAIRMKIKKEATAEGGAMAEGGALEEGEEEDEHTNQIRHLLSAQFGKVELDVESGKLLLNIDESQASVDVLSLAVECDNNALKERLEVALRRIKTAVFAVPDT